MLTGDENIVDIDFDVQWTRQPGAGAGLRVQPPEPGRHDQGGGRERHARGDRPAQHPDRPHDRAGERRRRRCGTSCSRRSTPTAPASSSTRAAPGGAAAGAGARGVLRRQRRAAGRGPRPERGRDLREPDRAARRAGEAARKVQQAEAYREQSIAGRDRPGGALQPGLRGIPQVARRSSASASSSRPWSACFGGMDKIIIDQNSQGQAGGIVPYLPLNELQRRPQQPAGQPSHCSSRERRDERPYPAHRRADPRSAPS